MAIDISTENLISLSEARSLIPGRPHISTLHRWLLRGVSGKRLESCRIGGKRYTSVEAIHRFIVAVSDRTIMPPVQPTSSSARASSRAKAERLLDEELGGIPPGMMPPPQG